MENTNFADVEIASNAGDVLTRLINTLKKLLWLERIKFARKHAVVIYKLSSYAAPLVVAARNAPLRRI